MKLAAIIAKRVSHVRVLPRPVDPSVERKAGVQNPPRGSSLDSAPDKRVNQVSPVPRDSTGTAA